MDATFGGWMRDLSRAVGESKPGSKIPIGKSLSGLPTD